jgi:alpha-L-fucosidase 2
LKKIHLGPEITNLQTPVSLRLIMQRSYLFYVSISQFLFLIFFSSPGAGQERALTLHYAKPAKVWEECVPLGNGRLGMMPDGGVTDENITLNEITLWSGSTQDANNYDANKYLPQIRELLAQGKNDEAQAIINEDFICKGAGSGNGDGAKVPFGCYQVLANLSIRFNYGDGQQPVYTHYNRELSLDKAVAKTTYTIKGITYTKEYFCSFGGDVSIVRITADQPHQINCAVALSRSENGETAVEGKSVILSGQLPAGDGRMGMKFMAKVMPVLTGGQLTYDDNRLVIRNATSLTLYISAATDFRKPDIHARVDSLLQVSLPKGYDIELQEHISGYRRLFKRVSLRVGNNTAANIPTDERIRNFQTKPDADPALPVLLYQYGRYLSICSTRVGLLPPNLQGLWANQTQTPWNGDYHLDVNVEMNHWPLEVSNLSELNLPLTKLVERMVPNGEKTAKAYYNARGWVAHVITNVWGFTEPGEAASWGITKVGSGWLCNNLWQHYDFTGDRQYLEEIYPVLKGAALFYSDMLVRDAQTGWLVTSPSSSPENTFYLPNGKTASICVGPTIDNQIIRELFGNVITAGRTLGVDSGFCDSLQQKIKQLPPAGRIAKDGRLMEWLQDYKETDIHHRHISHLYALYPGTLITTDGTPYLAEACRKTLEARGDDGPSWSIVYKQLFWARLHDGNHAYLLLKHLLRLTDRRDMNYGAGGGVYPNLFSAGPPFQIDANFGETAAIAEMLLQSQGGYIELLPAVPAAWKSSGEVRGLKARGNITVNFSWKNGRVTSYRLFSANKKTVRLKVNGVIHTVVVTNG